jgi:hypothetical protein
MRMSDCWSHGGWLMLGLIGSQLRGWQAFDQPPYVAGFRSATLCGRLSPRHSMCLTFNWILFSLQKFSGDYLVSKSFLGTI